MKYLITGANGFLGKHLCKYLESQKINYLGTVRSNPDANQFATGDLCSFSEWHKLFKGVDIVVHTAAKAHTMAKTKIHQDELNKFYTQINLELTKTIATNAKENGVKRFIFISTIKVNGESTPGVPFKAEDSAKPTDEYSISKHLAETELLKLHEPGLFEVVIIRPCLVYGAGVKANFESLIKLVQRRIPLPFSLVNNKRSLLSVTNLADLIVLCATSPKAAGQIFLAADDQYLNLSEIIIKIAKSLNVRPLLFPFPVAVMEAAASVVGQKKYADRLFGNLEVDIEKTKTMLNWQPKCQIDSLQLK